MSTVLMIHTVKGCSACNDLKSPANFTRLKNLVLQLDPKADIRIIEHDRWGVMEGQENYPNLGKIIFAPTLMLTSSYNFRGDGDPNKVFVYNAKYKPSTRSLERVSSQKSLEEWLKYTIPLVLKQKPSSFAPSQIIPPVVEPKPNPVVNSSHPPPAVVQSNVANSETSVKCKFKLVSYK